MNSSISSTNYIGSTSTQYEKQRRIEFFKTLTEIINEYVIPNFGKDLNFYLELGLFTSDQYGSYRISFCNKEKEEVCYIIADTIMGEWEVFKVKK